MATRRARSALKAPESKYSSANAIAASRFMATLPDCLGRFLSRCRGYGYAAVIEMAGHRTDSVGERARRLLRAARPGMQTARMENTTRRRVERVRDRKPKPGVRHAEAWLRREHGIEQRARIGVARLAEQCLARARLDDAAEIHHGDRKSTRLN